MCPNGGGGERGVGSEPTTQVRALKPLSEQANTLITDQHWPKTYFTDMLSSYFTTSLLGRGQLEQVLMVPFPFYRGGD